MTRKTTLTTLTKAFIFDSGVWGIHYRLNGELVQVQTGKLEDLINEVRLWGEANTVCLNRAKSYTAADIDNALHLSEHMCDDIQEDTKFVTESAYSEVLRVLEDLLG